LARGFLSDGASGPLADDAIGWGEMNALMA
jgi:hypothetical protein